MISKYNLRDIRKMWQEACLNVSVDWLKYLERPTYFAKRGEEIMFRPEQLAYLERNKEKVAVRRAQYITEESSVEIHDHGGWATISGFATSKDSTGVLGRHKFYEVWIVVDDRWQIASLFIDELDGSSHKFVK